MNNIVYLAVAWIAGIALAQAIHPPWQVLLVLGLIAILFLVLCWQEIRIRWVAGCVLVLVSGAGWFLRDLPRFDETSLATYNEVGWVTIEGVVVGEPDEREHHTNLRVEAEQLTLPDDTELEVEGLVLVSVEPYPQRQYGDRVRIEGVTGDTARLGRVFVSRVSGTPGYLLSDSTRASYVSGKESGQALAVLSFHLQAVCPIHYCAYPARATGSIADWHFAGN